MPVDEVAVSTEVRKDATIESTQAVFSMMMSLEVRVVHAEETDRLKPRDGVVAMISFTGDWYGTGVIHCEEKIACKIGGAMMMCELEHINTDVLDGVGELANMVLGGFKEAMASHVGQMTLSVPTVVYGKSFLVRTPIKAPWLEVRFEVDGEMFDVLVCMTKKNQ